MSRTPKGKQKVGMIYPVFAPITAYTEGSMPTYGTGKVIMEARTATVTFEYGNNPDYGDDRVVAEDNAPTGMTMQFESTGISNADRIAMLAEEARSSGGGQWISDQPTPWGGFGYIDKMLDEDAENYDYEAWITLKIHFREESRTSQTREGSIAWGHPVFQGRAIPIDVDGSGKQRFQLHETFETAAAAKAFINGILNVPSATST